VAVRRAHSSVRAAQGAGADESALRPETEAEFAVIPVVHYVPMLPGETYGQWLALGADERQRRSDELWAERKTAPFPLAWVAKLLRKLWKGYRSTPTDETPDPRGDAKVALLHETKELAACFKAGLQPDANDGDVVQEARESARDMARRLQQRDVITPQEWPEGVRLLAQWSEALEWLESRGLMDYRTARGRIAGLLKRTQCERWWRRVLRRLHAKAVEATARGMGLVSKRAGCYVSDDGLKMRTGQIARNAAALKSVIAVNDAGQDFELAELAAKGPANREIRRHELMTRIAGFELIARQCEHEALFVTVTCPSRMHAVRVRRGGLRGVQDNPKFDGTTPGEAQAYLSGQWAKFRSACERWGVELYGFRIAEPNHDGTPHWHALLFLPPTVGPGLVRANARVGRPAAVRVAVRLLRRYFFRDAGKPEDQSEAGARKHRVKVEKIDWSRGSAAGYIAKYVSKNIDGYKVEKDLYGNDTLSASKRVDAWASIWRIRQFQQIGGAPVTIWRELRRLHPEQASVAPTIGLALDAVNVAARADDIDACHDIARNETAAHGWATYLELQGGHRVPRKLLRIRLLKEQLGELGRYGDPVPPRAVGIVTTEVTRDETPAFGIVMRPIVRTVPVVREVESERSTWVMTARGCVAHVAQRMRTGVELARPARPGSPVNNCTRRVEEGFAVHPDPLFAPLVRRTPKLGRWHRWKGREGPALRSEV
jgi:hypothetical protein